MDDSEGEEDEQKGRGGGMKTADRRQNSLDNLVRFAKGSGE